MVSSFAERVEEGKSQEGGTSCGGLGKPRLSNYSYPSLMKGMEFRKNGSTQEQIQVTNSQKKPRSFETLKELQVQRKRWGRKRESKPNTKGIGILKEASNKRVLGYGSGGGGVWGSEVDEFHKKKRNRGKETKPEHMTTGIPDCTQKILAKRLFKCIDQGKPFR